MSEVVHIALKGDVIAMCDAPIDRSAPRVAEPEQATCGECVDTYIEGWAAARDGMPRGVPPLPAHPPSRRRPAWLYAALGAGAASLVAAALYWITSSGGDEGADIAVAVVDCSRTVYYQPNDSSAMLLARVAQIQFVNNTDEKVVFSPRVDGVTLVGDDGKRITYTLAPHDSTMTNYRMNPKKYGDSEGACYALNAGVAQ